MNGLCGIGRPGRWCSAVAWVAVVTMSGCGPEPRGGESDTRTSNNREETIGLLVYAAASTRDVMQAIEELYEQAQRVDLVYNFASSGTLSRQIIAAASADVFLSADVTEMDRVDSAGLLLAGTRRPLLSNELVVIEPAGDPSRFEAPFAPEQLATAKITRVSLADTRTVPAGRYAREWLQRRGLWDAIEARVVPALDVRAALAAVEAGAADVGIVYRTDAARSRAVHVLFSVPAEESPAISYPVAVIATSRNASAAREFVNFLTSAVAAGVFRKHGFVLDDGVLRAPGS